jgi:diaminohydroxyphosphoribosylaminopyrimidine deaminase/5-amino-6-(5-phosphoribosylamino)uracil reductase
MPTNFAIGTLALTRAGASGDDTDRSFMQIALRLAKRGLGATAPNPSVGAVVVDEATGEVVARGWTQFGGRPHAETEALQRAGPRARGATMYVTLEPCSHYGKTPPCAEAIIKAGISRVVTGILDPDPRVAGRGLEMLRAAGLEVCRGVCAAEADYLTRGHILRVTERRPFVQVKMALGRDGVVPRGAKGVPVWVTGEAARAHGHLLRARADAILVGEGTVEDDDPDLTCRLPGLRNRSPMRVVLCGRRLLASESKLARTAREHEVLVFCPSGSEPSHLAELQTAGCRILQVATVGGRPWIPAVTEALVGDGITRLLVEGGPTVWRSFFASGLVDEVVVYRAGGYHGARGAAEAVTSELGAFAGPMSFALVGAQPAGEDGLYIFHRTRGR